MPKTILGDENVPRVQDVGGQRDAPKSPGGIEPSGKEMSERRSEEREVRTERRGRQGTESGSRVSEGPPPVQASLRISGDSEKSAQEIIEGQGRVRQVAAHKRPRPTAFLDGDALCREAIALAIDGQQSAPRGFGVRECQRPVVLTLLDVHDPFMHSLARKPNYRFGLAEACWILAGSDDAQLIGKYNKQMLKFSDDGKRMWGAYGPRLMGQLEHVVQTLMRDRDSRQAVLTTWRPMVDTIPDAGNIGHVEDIRAGGLVPYCDDNVHWDGASWRSKDVPCTVAWHFQIRHDRLNLTVFMRSNDVWLGLPYDLLSFTTVQRVVASMLGVRSGEYNHVASNLHIYDENFEAATQVLEEDSPWPTVKMPEMGDCFKTWDADHITNAFNDVLLAPESMTFIEPLLPFRAAVLKNPELWPDLRDLQIANGRGRTPQK